MTAHDAGFSVLEILVVLAIMGIMLSLLGARMMNSIEATRFARTVDAAAADIRLIRADAMLSGTPRVIVPNILITGAGPVKAPMNQRRALTLPMGWSAAGAPITISASGVCAGGTIRFAAPDGRIADYAVLPPKCEARRIPAAS